MLSTLSGKILSIAMNCGTIKIGIGRKGLMLRHDWN